MNENLERLSLCARAVAQPDTLALVTPERSWSYSQAACQVQQIVGALSALSDATQGVCVAFHAHSTVQTVFLTWALMECGIPFVPLHPRWTATDCARVLSETGAVLIEPGVGNSPLTETCRNLLSSRAEQPVGAAIASAVAGVSPSYAESILAVVYTSGSSAKPRGVRLSRRAFAAAAHSSQVQLKLTPHDRWYLTLPLGHVGGLSILTRCLWAGAAVVLAPQPESALHRASFEAMEFARAGAAMGVTLVSLVPTQLKRLCDENVPPPASLRVALVGGAALDSTLRERAAGLGWPITRTYGLTESCAQLATDGHADAASGLRAVPGVEVALSSGRLALRSAALFSGYVGAPALKPDGWFVTNDLALFDSDGTFHILGRADDVIVTGGENVNPDEIEAALAECAGVDSACVFGLPSDEWGQEVCVLIVALDVGPPFSLAHCQQQIRERLSAFKVPKRWALVDSLPVGPSGKVSRTEAALRFASVCSRANSE